MADLMPDQAAQVNPQQVNPQELEQRKKGWTDFFSRVQTDPVMQMGLLQAGIGMMQPVPQYQSPGAHIMSALGEGMAPVIARNIPPTQMQQLGLMKTQSEIAKNLASAQKDVTQPVHLPEVKNNIPIRYNSNTGDMEVMGKDGWVPYSPEAIKPYTEAAQKMNPATRYSNAVAVDDPNNPGNSVLVKYDHWNNDAPVYADTKESIIGGGQAQQAQGLQGLPSELQGKPTKNIGGTDYVQTEPGNWIKAPTAQAKAKHLGPAAKAVSQRGPTPFTSSQLTSFSSAAVDVKTIRSNLFDSKGNLDKSVLWAMHLPDIPGGKLLSETFLPEDIHTKSDAAGRTLNSLIALRGQIEYGLRGGSTEATRADEMARYGIGPGDNATTAKRVLDRLERWMKVGKFIGDNRRSPTDAELKSMLGQEEFKWFTSNPMTKPAPEQQQPTVQQIMPPMVE